MINAKLRFALIAGFSLMSAATIRAMESSAGSSAPVSADSLFAVFVDLRTSITFHHSIAQHEDRSVRLRLQLIKPPPTNADLQMHVTDACKRPATYTIGFVLEDGAWRISRTSHDSSRNGQAWFKSDLKPLKKFPSITLRDRVRYLNESTLGTSLGLHVNNRGCSK